MRLLVMVTQRDISEGQKQDQVNRCISCPIAMALRRAINKAPLKVNVDYPHVLNVNIGQTAAFLRVQSKNDYRLRHSISLDLPAIALMFIDKADNEFPTKKGMKPFSFYLNIQPWLKEKFLVKKGKKSGNSNKV